MTSVLRNIFCVRTLTMLTLGFAAAVAAPARGDVTLVPPGAIWKYLDDGSNQGTAWRDPVFMDGDWEPGPAQLGYGDGDEATVVSFGGDPNDKHITTYFRHRFNVPDPGAFLGLTLRLVRDDGAVVYLNGIEVFRSNMPNGSIGYLTVASSSVGGADESAFHETVVPLSTLLAGQNTLAVEIHQRSGTSSDISFDLELIGNDGAPTVVRGPYLQRATSDRVVVKWRTSFGADSELRYGPAPGDLPHVVSSARIVTRHALELTGLAAGTTYYYGVYAGGELVAGGDAGHRFVTAPEPSAAPPVRVWVIGDSGTADANAAAVYTAYRSVTGAARTDVWLMLGDNAYGDGTDVEYQAAVFDMYPEMLRTTPVWATLGNHDAVSADSDTESGVYYEVFTLPREAEAGGHPSGTEAYYSFDFGNVHFVCLDSHDSNRAPGGAMLTWLADDLADTLADWVIAFWHHPPYTKGSHDSDNSADSGGRMRDMRQNALPILEAAGVDLVLCGHSHSYERSVLLDGHYSSSGNLLQSMIVDEGDGREGGDGAYEKPSGRAANAGAVYAVAGSSGKIGGGPLNHPAMFISLNTLGSMILEVDGLRLDATFLDAAAAERDTFTILKSCGLAADLDDDGQVAFGDLLAVLAAWGPCPGCPEDLDGSGAVGFADLLEILGNWGGCR